jgi:hypothetical protein
MPSVTRNLNEASGTYQSALIGLGVGLFSHDPINISARPATSMPLPGAS